MALHSFFRQAACALSALTLAGCSPSSQTSPVNAPPQPFIALLTDYGWEDSYVAQLKGTILTVNPDARLIDLTHEIDPFNFVEGAFLLDQAASEFPAGTIFVAVVDPQVGNDRAPILLKTKRGKFYIGPDNGVFTQVIDHEGFAEAWKLDQPKYFRAGSVSQTFHGRDIFGPVAAHLARGVPPDSLGTALTQKELTLLSIKDPSFSGSTLSTTILHVDHFGNVILNLRNNDPLAEKLHEGSLVKLSIGKESYSAPLVKNYAEVEKNRLILLYGSSDFIEIALKQGSAAKMLKAEPGTVIYLKP